MMWRDRLFWALFLGGLFFYALMLFVGPWASIAGSALWIVAFAYLVIESVEKRFGRDNSGESKGKK